ncbi:hypothetical protein Q9Q94_12645 [Uliginosibacterium sp. 31-16]|uniref:hypothetical protein n=1 Tax=Uliginosibacterium sp. 31-16 TaxID=3068315 RepID=UPI0027402E23|nr:hypothetical protein [Uliginosibacterium sp. 31-16]MDP5240383.1 hypothetical protein [Uliginosibacterium sp. 31-16]
MSFQIESTSHCPSGLAPRWSWWIRGIHGSRRYGIVGTDEQGYGLYLFNHHANHAPNREALVSTTEFSLSGNVSRAEAITRLTQALITLGWQQPGLQST